MFEDQAATRREQIREKLLADGECAVRDRIARGAYSAEKHRVAVEWLVEIDAANRDRIEAAEREKDRKLAREANSISRASGLIALAALFVAIIALFK